MQRRIKNILIKIAEEEKLPYKVVESVYYSQFKLANKRVIVGEKGKPETFLNVRFPIIGVLKTTEERINKIYEVCNSRKEE
jgi:hypothetical protein